MLDWSTFKLATLVVLVTTNGAVPVATLDMNCGVVILALANTCAVPKLPTLALPTTLAVPEIFAPVAVIVSWLVTLPVTKYEILALAVIVILLLPFCIRPLLIVVILPVVIIAVAVPKLPTLALPVTLAVPGIFAPVEVTTNCAVALPPMNVETFPADAMVILLVLFFINPLLIVVILPVVAINVVVPKLPVLALLVTFNNVVVKLPVAALNDKLALAPCARLPDVAFTNIGYQVPVVVSAVLAYSETFALATNKLGTSVVLVTVNGDVPVAIFETNIGLVTAIVALMFAAITLPEDKVNVVVFLSKVNAATPFEIF